MKSEKAYPTHVKPHPGLILAAELARLELSQAALARIIGVSAMRISLVVAGHRPITAELALRLRPLGRPASFWLHRQCQFDLGKARASLGGRLGRPKRIRASRRY